jgi:GMP synthase (glutamine-hydrolysing)
MTVRSIPVISPKPTPVTKPLRFLVVDGNIRSARQEHSDTYGASPGESYARVVAGLEGEAVIDIALPADEGSTLPDGQGLEGYDAVFLTGSSLNIYRQELAVARQIELMRAVYASGTPCFGSCWGLQMGAVAAGGVVHHNPRGREVGFARRVTLTDAGMAHPLMAGRPRVFDAPCTHEDEVAVLPGETTPLASNAMSAVQAAEIRHGGGLFWGVQYHPEFSLHELAAIMRRRRVRLVEEGFYATPESADLHLADLETLHADPARKDLAWKLGLDAEVLDEGRRLTEIRNFLAHAVSPARSARGRG